jgi:hypothetical protein
MDENFCNPWSKLTAAIRPDIVTGWDVAENFGAWCPAESNMRGHAIQSEIFRVLRRKKREPLPK